MLSKLLAVLCLCLAANANAEFRHFGDWTTEEKAWFGTYTALSYIDYKQTMWMVKQKYPNGEWMYYEANPMFPERVRSHQIGSAKLAGLALQYWLVGEYGFKEKPVKWGLMFNTITQGAVVVHNHHIGINISVAF